MKLTLFFLALIVAPSIFAQRGIYPIKKKINGKFVTLYEKSYALVIGNSRYTAGWQSLDGVKTDVQNVKTALEGNGFKVFVKENLTKTQMNTEIADFLSTYGYDDNNRVLLYFAGHGHTLTINNTQMGYIVPVDAPDPRYDKRGFLSKAIPMSNFKTWSESTTVSKHALFMFDACFAGSIFRSRGENTEGAVISYNTLNPVRQFIASGSANEKVPDQSVFCTQFVHALRSTDADYNKDDYLTATELGEYLKNTVIEYRKNRQHPQYGKLDNPNYDKGDFVFPLKKQITKTATLKITSDFSGKLFIDGDPLQNILDNETETISVAPGDHTVKVQHGENIWEADVYLSENQELPIYPEGSVVDNNDNDRSNTNFEKDFTVPAAGMDIKMRGIQGGTFKMGSNDGDSDEKPVHTVTLGNFAMSKYEVTVGEYLTFCKATNSHLPEWLEKNSSYYIHGSDKNYYSSRGMSETNVNYPITGVSWNNAVAYCKWLSQETGQTWRLPTEAEWEYAARGGQNYKYAGSNDIDDVAWQSGNSNSKTHPVGKKKPNGYGLYDMSGNVWEWCSDWYGDYKSSSQTNPQGASSGSFRVNRGGSWRYNGSNCRSADRDYYSPGSRNSYIGFRLVFVP